MDHSPRNFQFQNVILIELHSLYLNIGVCIVEIRLNIHSLICKSDL